VEEGDYEDRNPYSKHLEKLRERPSLREAREFNRPICITRTRLTKVLLFSQNKHVAKKNPVLCIRRKKHSLNYTYIISLTQVLTPVNNVL